MRISNAVRIGVAVAGLLAATVVGGCSNTVDGRAICIGCGPTEPGLPSPTPPTTSTPSGSTLDPSSSGYVYIQTKSGLTRCQINAESVGCEAPFENPPELNGEPANGVEVSADGSVNWRVGNLGDIPAVTLDYATYHAVGWTIEAANDGTRFTNDGTGHGMFVSIEKVEIF